MLYFLQDNKDINITVRVFHIELEKLRKFSKTDTSLSLKKIWLERDYARVFHLTFLRFKFAQLSNEDKQCGQKNWYHVKLISTSMQHSPLLRTQNPSFLICPI